VSGRILSEVGGHNAHPKIAEIAMLSHYVPLYLPSIRECHLRGYREADLDAAVAAERI
jgi:hypothetical protein